MNRNCPYQLMGLHLQPGYPDGQEKLMTSQQENQYQAHTVGWRLYPKETGKPYRQYGKDRKQDQKEAEYDPEDPVLQLDSPSADTQRNDGKHRHTSQKQQHTQLPR